MLDVAGVERLGRGRMRVDETLGVDGRVGVEEGRLGVRGIVGRLYFYTDVPRVMAGRRARRGRRRGHKVRFG